MIKWKKQCEFCNKNLRMKTEIEAITNKRSFSESAEKKKRKCVNMQEGEELRFGWKTKDEARY
jgi:hypothetical protein